MTRIVFLHGLESRVNDQLVPVGRKARWLRQHHGAATPALDTRGAVAARDAAAETWRYPFPGYEEAFATPLARARDAIGPNTELVVGSSFGGAVLLRLIHEGGWAGPCLFLAGAGVKLTPHRTLPRWRRCLLVHGRQDEIVPLSEARQLAASSPDAALWEVDDGHRLGSILEDGTLQRAITWCLEG